MFIIVLYTTIVRVSWVIHPPPQGGRFSHIYHKKKFQPGFNKILMVISEIQQKAQEAIGEGNYRGCVGWCLTAIFTASGLDWPYFLLGESFSGLGDKNLSKSFYELYLSRSKSSIDHPWIQRAKKGLDV